MTNKTSNAAINIHKNKNFDFSNIAGLNSFWDGGQDRGGWGGGTFNKDTAHNVSTLYQGLVGRNADPAGEKYWVDKISSGANTYQTLIDSLKASNEYQDQQIGIEAGGTADQLKGLGSAYVSPFHPDSGSGVAGWTPGDDITQSVAESGSSNYADQTNKNVLDVYNSLGITGGVGNGGSMRGNPYDDSELRELIGGLTGQLGDLRSAFDAYKSQSKSDMENMWNNANWGWGQTVGGVRTQNELPGWAPKKGGTSGFFGRGGRAGKGLTTAALNL